MAYLADILINVNKSGLLFKNNIKYIKGKFMQDSKMTKKLIELFFNNLNLIAIQDYLSCKNKNKIKILIIKLLYRKIT